MKQILLAASLCLALPGCAVIGIGLAGVAAENVAYGEESYTTRRSTTPVTRPVGAPGRRLLSGQLNAPKVRHYCWTHLPFWRLNQVPLGALPMISLA